MEKIIILSLTLSSCAYGPSQEKKSSLNYLNGEHYEKSASVFGVPVVERKIKDTIISGRIQMDDPFAKLPSEVEVRLVNDGRIISTVHANKLGVFQFQGIYPNGSYALKAIASYFSGESFIEVDSYKITDALVVMQKIH